MARKLRDSDIATQWTLNYQLTSRLRMQFTLASASPYPRTLLCQYSTGETPPQCFCIGPDRHARGTMGVVRC